MYLEWQACRDLSQHTLATVKELQRLRIRCWPDVKALQFLQKHLFATHINMALLLSKQSSPLTPTCVMTPWPWCRPSFQKFVVEQAKDDIDWCFPKFFNMRKYEELILLYGNVEQLSSAPRERSNADFKAHAAFTNRHSTTIQQVTRSSCHNGMSPHDVHEFWPLNLVLVLPFANGHSRAAV